MKNEKTKQKKKNSIVNDPAKYDETVLLRARIIANAALVVKLRANLGINVDKAVTEAFNIGSEPSKYFCPLFACVSYGIRSGQPGRVCRQLLFLQRRVQSKHL